MKKLSLNPAKIILRHPMVYYIRYILLSKNNESKNAEGLGCFNDFNEISDVPALYFEVNAKIPLHPEMDGFDKALAIARYLRSNIKGGTGIGLSSQKTLQKMLTGKGGVCSDFAQIFNIFCFINDVKVREWGCVDRLYNSRFGHSFNEIFSEKLRRWIAIDSEKGIFFRDSENNLLSVKGLFDDLRAGNPLNFEYFSDYIPDKIFRVTNIYTKNAMPFLVNNYRVKVNDYFFDKLRRFPPFLINIIIILLRKNHDFIFIMDNYKSKLLPKQLRNR